VSDPNPHPETHARDHDAHHHGAPYRALRWALYGIGGVLALVLLLGGGALLWLRTGSGSSFVVSKIEAAVPGLKLEGVSGLPFDFRADRITMADRDGVWLTMEGVVGDLAGRALLGQTVRLEELSATRVNVARAPVPEEKPEEPKDPNAAFELPVGVEVKRLSLPRIELGAPLLGGEPALLSAEGSAALPAGTPQGTANLVVNRIDDKPGRVALAATYVPNQKLDLDLKAEEPGGGVIAGLLGIEGKPPVSVTLNGKGPLENWAGRLEAKAGDAVSAVADATIKAVQGRYGFGLNGTAAVSPLLPEEYRALAGDNVTIQAAGTIEPGSRVLIDNAQVNAAAATVTAKGAYGLDAAGAMDLAFDAKAGPESPLHALVEEPVWRSLSLAGTLKGTAREPQLDANLVADGTAFGQVQAERLAATVTTRPQGGDVLGFTLDAALEGVTSADPNLKGIDGARPTVALAGSLNRATTDVKLDRLELDAFATKLAGTATVGRGGETAQANLTLRSEDLSRLGAALARPEMKGALNLQADLDKKGQDLTANVKGGGEGLTLGIPAADALLAGRATLSAAVTKRGEETLVRDLAVTGGNLRATGEATLRGKVLTSRFDATIADLAPLGVAVGTPLEGAARVEATATGPTDNLAARATLTSDGMKVQTQQFGPTRLVADMKGLPDNIRGRVDGDASVEGRPLKLGADISKQGDNLRLADLGLSLGANRIAGAIEANLAAPTATGQLRADLPDLAPLAALAGQAVEGRATATIKLDAPKGKQSVALDMNAQQIARTLPTGDRQSLGRLTVTGRVEDATSPKPRVDLRAEARDARLPDGRLDGITATLAGPLSDARFAFNTTGEIGKPLRLDAAGTLARTEAATSVTLTRFEGRYDGTGLSQQGRATFTQGADGVKVQGLRLVSGNARITADGQLGQKAVQAKAEIARLPLSLVRMIDPTLPLHGEINGNLTLGGSPQDPRGDLRLAMTGLGVEERPPSRDEELNARLEGTWRGGRVASTLRAEGRTGALDLTARLEGPLVMRDGAPAVPDEGPISGQVRGALDMAALNDFLAASGDRLAGGMRVALDIGGTAGDPRLAGSVGIDKGRYENHKLGTIVENIQARLEGSPEGLVIRQFTGATPKGGTLEAGGAIRIDPSWGDRQIEVTFKANNAKVVQIDEAQAWADADLSLRGSFQTMLLDGRVRLRKAYISFPEKLPAAVAELEVVEVRNGIPIDDEKTMVAMARKQQPAAARIINLRLEAVAANQIYVQGRGLDAEFKADLDIGGTTDDPQITGAVDLVKGTLSALGQTFELERAKATFQGGTDPTLDISARAERGDFTAIVNVTGRPSDPKLQLSSEPAVPEDEILARLLFDRSVGELSALEALQLAQSAAQLAGVGGSGPGIMDKVKRGLGVDRLEFKGSENGEGPGTVAAGRYIGRNLYVGVENELGTGQSKVTGEYEATDTIKLRGAVGRDSEVGVQFEWDY